MSDSSPVAKTYFRDKFLADDYIRPLNHDLVWEIITKFHPRSVFEFGCGQGKNLALLLEEFGNLIVTDKAVGIDVSEYAIKKGRQSHPSLNSDSNHRISVGDEDTLVYMKSKSFDVSFTCSVLDHIEKEETIAEIINHLKRISKQGVILYETVVDNKQDIYYYPHDYDSYGFKRDPPDYAYVSNPGDGNTYSIWQWRRK